MALIPIWIMLRTLQRALLTREAPEINRIRSECWMLFLFCPQCIPLQSSLQCESEMGLSSRPSTKTSYRFGELQNSSPLGTADNVVDVEAKLVKALLHTGNLSWLVPEAIFGKYYIKYKTKFHARCRFRPVRRRRRHQFQQMHQPCKSISRLLTTSRAFT